MKQKTLKTLLACLLAFAGMGKSYAHDIEVANADGVTVYYNFINDQTELEVTYEGSIYWNAVYAGKVVIPESVTHEGKTYPVTSIGANAFYNCTNMTEVTIPNSATSIGYHAFCQCRNLAEIIFPNSVTSIDWEAFYGCTSLTEVTIPSSVTSIGTNPFSYCSGLEKVVVESGNPKYDSRENCNAIIETSSNELIAGFKITTIPNSVTSIGSHAFYTCMNLGELTMPESVTSIGSYAFYNCDGLTKVIIGSGVTSIGYMAFSRCWDLTEVTISSSVTFLDGNPFTEGWSLEKIIVESGNPVYDSREDCNAIIETSSNELITGCKNTTIPESVTSIGKSAFNNCVYMTEMTIPNSVTSIGERAFSTCTSLTEMTIPNSVTSIGGGAFSSCTSLTKVTIGNNITSIASEVFYNCRSLVTIYSLNTTPPSVDSWNFTDEQYPTVDVFVPQESLEAYQSADVWKEFQKLQAIPDDGGTTAIEQVRGNVDTETVTVYTLEGKKQTMKKADVQSLPSGIYIVDGKKYVVK